MVLLSIFMLLSFLFSMARYLKALSVSFEAPMNEMCLRVWQWATSFSTMLSSHSGMSSISSVLRMGQPLPINSIPSAETLVHPERSRYTKRLQPLPVVMDFRPLLVK